MDKFYTNADVVQMCLKYFEKYYTWNEWDLILEPSAGNGNFYLNIPSNNKIGIDIEPEHDSIQKCDLFKWSPPKKNMNILTIGNPPFGRISSMAVKFFNKTAEYSQVIAFIIPKTFRKISIQNKLNLNFHLVADMDIPNKPCSFTPKMNAKCCFQIWVKLKTKREKIELPISHIDWEFLKFGPKDDNNQPTPPNGSDFALRAYGGKCGEIVTENLHTLRPKSWHWIKSNIDVDVLKNNFNRLNYENCHNTARQNSIGKAELIQLYSQLII